MDFNKYLKDYFLILTISIMILKIINIPFRFIVINLIFIAIYFLLAYKLSSFNIYLFNFIGIINAYFIIKYLENKTIHSIYISIISNNFKYLFKICKIAGYVIMFIGISFLIYSLFIFLSKKIDKKTLRNETLEQEEQNLFESRKVDLENVIDYIKIYNIIGIDGIWGFGKTFFMKKLEERLEKDNKYKIIRIPLVSYDLENIEYVILNEIDIILSENKILNTSLLKFKNFISENVFTNFLFTLISNEKTYITSLKKFKESINKLENPICIIYEDIDRIQDEQVIVKIFNISEHLTCYNTKIKIIYEYNKEELQKRENFNFYFLEKYIPHYYKLSNVDFNSILVEFNKGRLLKKLNLKDFNFFSDINELVNYKYLKKILGINLNDLELPLDANIRKTELFLEEVSTSIDVNKYEIFNSIEKGHVTRILITHYFIKYFFHEIYRDIEKKDNVLEALLFKFDNRVFTIQDLFQEVEHKDDESKKEFVNKFLSYGNNSTILHLISMFEFDFSDSYNLYDYTDKQNFNNKINRLFYYLVDSSTNTLTPLEELYTPEINKDDINRLEDLIEYTKSFLVIKQKNISWKEYLEVCLKLSNEYEYEDYNFYDFYEYKLIETKIQLIYIANYFNIEDKNFFLEVLKIFNELKNDAINDNLIIDKYTKVYYENKFDNYITFLYYYLYNLYKLGYIPDDVDYYIISHSSLYDTFKETIEHEKLIQLLTKIKEYFDGLRLKKIEMLNQEIEIISEFLNINIEIVKSKFVCKYLQELKPSLKKYKFNIYDTNLYVNETQSYYRDRVIRTTAEEFSNKLKTELDENKIDDPETIWKICNDFYKKNPNQTRKLIEVLLNKND